jgi:uncharacterized protein (DUF305 family)
VTDRVRAFVTAVALSVVASGCMPDAGSFDTQFIDMMVPHHQGAIEMAQIARTRANHGQLRALAEQIISDQQREIDQMREWRAQWFGPRELGPILPEVLGVADNEFGMKHGSADEVTRAVDVDATFAALMIPHHEGAIAKAEAARDRGQHEEVKELAAAIIDAQEREIEIMDKHASGEHHGS